MASESKLSTMPEGIIDLGAPRIDADLAKAILPLLEFLNTHSDATCICGSFALRTFLSTNRVHVLWEPKDIDVFRITPG